MPTRSIGDLRLKKKEFNFHDFAPEYGYRKPIPNFTGPYITAEPDVQVHKLTDKDKYLVLASDGLWDEVKRTESAKVASKLFSEGTEHERIKNKAFTFQLSYELCQAAQRSAVKKSDYSMDYFLRMEPGAKKREVIDDITIIVADLQ